jgi:dipeptidase E
VKTGQDISIQKPNRQIIAMGGGGFTAVPENLALDAYILRQSKKSTPSVCFIGTATGDSAPYLAKFYAAYSKLNSRPTHLPLFERTPDPRSLLLQQDVIYVGGGNTKSMLAVWREWGLPEFLREAWESGVILAGISAGAICWFEAGITDSWERKLFPLDCLGFLPGGCCPHYDTESDRRPTLHELVSQANFPPTLALEDGVAAHFQGTELIRVVSSHPKAKAFRVQFDNDEAAETPLPVERLQ